MCVGGVVFVCSWVRFSCLFFACFSLILFFCVYFLYLLIVFVSGVYVLLCVCSLCFGDFFCVYISLCGVTFFFSD